MLQGSNRAKVKRSQSFSQREYTHILHQNIDTSKSVDLGYPQGAPLRINCVGVPLSCRFFMRGEPPHKNAACGYPWVVAVIVTEYWCKM
jgi:hypothetical protein